MVIAILGSSREACDALALVSKAVDTRRSGRKPAILTTESKCKLHQTVAAFRSISAELERLVGEFDRDWMDQPTVLVDRYKISSPIADFNGVQDTWNVLIGLLILAFPDLHWCFAHIEPPAEDEAKKSWVDALVNRFHSLDSLDPGKLPASNLFDASGLREMVRRSMSVKGLVKRSGKDGLEVAVAMDDERQYGHLSAFFAYRNGYRCLLIDSHGLGKDLIGTTDLAEKLRSSALSWALSIEDLNLRLSDHENNLQLTSWENRKKAFPTLCNVRYVRVVTAATEAEVDGHIKKRREECDASSNRGQEKNSCVSQIAKPVGGLTDPEWNIQTITLEALWQSDPTATTQNDSSKLIPRGFYKEWAKARLRGKERWILQQLSISVPWWCMPCDNIARDVGSSDGEYTGHSAPGRILEVANVLLSRATRLSRLSDELNSPVPAIRAAALALDAKELLAGKTPTTAITAIEVRHSAELRAECHFAGVVLTTEGLQNRIAEVWTEISEIVPSEHSTSPEGILGCAWAELRSLWYGSSRRRDAAMAGVVSRLLATIEGRHQIDAELELLKEDRRLQNRVRWHQRSSCATRVDLSPFRQIEKVAPLCSFLGMRYLNWLLSGFIPLTRASLYWLVVLCLPLSKGAPSAAEGMSSVYDPQNSIEVFQYSVLTFLGVGQPNMVGREADHMIWFIAVVALMLIGLLHVGILISQLYSIASRR